jgi:tetratricopeptide (TPR) repeat protein
MMKEVKSIRFLLLLLPLSTWAAEELWMSDLSVGRFETRQRRWEERFTKRRKSTQNSGDLKYPYRAFYRRLDPRLGRTTDQDKAILWLFTMAWKSVEAGKFALAEEAFTKIILRGALLSDEERAMAFMGRAVAGYNRFGCDSINSDLVEADRHKSAAAEVSFYRGLCFMEKKYYVEAESLFERVIESGPSTVEEAAQFYRGLVWEITNQFDRAESAYLELIAYGSDAGLLEKARKRLEAIQKDLKAYLNEKKWWSALAQAGVGYDTNAISLPQELRPVAFGFWKSDSPFYQGLFFGEVRPAWSNTFFHQLRYTLFAHHYYEYLISKELDVLSHDIQSGQYWKLGAYNRIGTLLSYNSISVGEFSAHQEYMAIPSLKLYYKKVGTFGLLKKLKKQPTFEGAEESTQAQVYAKVSRLIPKQGYVTPDLDPRAMVYTLGWDQHYFESDYFNWGHKTFVEAKYSDGKENTYYSGSLSFQYSYLLDWTFEGVTLANDYGLQYYSFYKSGANRHDYLVKSNLSFTHGMWKNADLQWLVNFTGNFSTEKATNQFVKVYGQLSLSQYF